MADQVRIEVERLGPPGPLLDACKHALLVNPSNRIRAILVMGMAQAAGTEADLSLAVAGVEFIISAAKAVDDLPFMDDSSERGGVAASHSAFGVGNTLLASYVLITGGYDCVRLNADQIASSSLCYADTSHRRLARVIQEFSDCIGARGAALGQCRDLSNVRAKDEDDLLSVIDLKTSKLYAMAATTGWLLGGGDLQLLGAVRTAAMHLGRGMQIKDDIEDADQDSAAGRRFNYAVEYGLTVAQLRIRSELSCYQNAIRSLPGEHSLLEALSLPLYLSFSSHNLSAPTEC